MAMWHEPAMAFQMIRDLELTRLVAYDINGSEPIFRCDNRKPDEICTELERLLGWVQDGVRVECGKVGDYVDKGGKPGVGSIRKPMVWRFRPAAEERAPIVQHAAPMATPTAPPSGWVSPEVQALTLEVQRLTLELDARRPADPDDDDDIDEPEPLDRAAAVVDVVKGIRQAMPELFTFFGGKQTPITGTIPPGGIGDDAELMAALSALKGSEPETFANYRGLLLQQYGKKVDNG